MQEKTYKEKYDEQTKICDAKIAIIQPFLKQFAVTHNEGTGFYEDVTVLCGPGGMEYNYIRDNRKDLFERWQKGEVSIYNIKWAGLTFVIDYKFSHTGIFEYHGQKFAKPVYTPINATAIYKHNEQPVNLDLAIAVKDLYNAQEYRSALYGCILEQERR